MDGFRIERAFGGRILIMSYRKRGLERRDPEKFYESEPQEAIADDAAAAEGVCPHPPLGHPHPGDHLTNGAFSKLLLNAGRQ